MQIRYCKKERKTNRKTKKKIKKTTEGIMTPKTA